MSEIAKLYKRIDSLNRKDIRLVANYVNKIIDGKNNNISKKTKKVILNRYQAVGKKFNKDATKYIEELRNEW